MKRGILMNSLSELQLLGLNDLLKSLYEKEYAISHEVDLIFGFKNTKDFDIKVDLQDIDFAETHELLHDFGMLAKCQIEKGGIGKEDWNKAAELDVLTAYIYNDYHVGNKYLEEVLKEAIHEFYSSESFLTNKVALASKEEGAYYFQSYFHDYKIDISDESKQVFEMERFHRYKDHEMRKVGEFNKQEILDKCFKQALMDENLLEYFHLKNGLELKLKDVVDHVLEPKLEGSKSVTRNKKRELER